MFRARFLTLLKILQRNLCDRGERQSKNKKPNGPFQTRCALIVYWRHIWRPTKMTGKESLVGGNRYRATQKKPIMDM